MNKIKPTVLALTAAVVLLLGLVGAQAANNLTAKPTAVAAVEVERVFNSLKQKSEFEAQQQIRQNELRDNAQAKQRAVETLSSDLDMLTPNTPAFATKQAEVEQAAIELQVWGRYQEQQMARTAALHYEKIYRDTLDAISRIAQETGYELVVFKETSPNFRYENLQQLANQIQARKVLYAANTVDITDAVIRRMNTEFDTSR